jgi:4-hydroxybenzoate polyprenyltransferase
MYFLLGLFYNLATTHVQLAGFIQHNWAGLVAILLALGTWYISGTALNDYEDYEIDKINLKGDKQRPLIQGWLGRRQLLYFAVAASILTLLLALATGHTSLVLLFAGLLLLNVAYSLPPLQISHRGGLAPALLPLGYIFLPVTAGLLLGNDTIPHGAYLIILALYLHFVARILLKDHRDVKGDVKAGKRTMVLAYGNKFVVKLCAGAFILSSLLFAVALATNYIYLLFFVALMFGGALMALRELYNEEEWPYQRPLITIFGRMCSGLITVIITGLLTEIVNLTHYQVYTVLLIVSVMFFMSTTSILRLQKPADDALL